MKIKYNGDGNEFDLENLAQSKFPCFIKIGKIQKLFFDNQFDSKFECDIDFECDPQEIFDRTSSVCGGDILMSGHCMMTLNKVESVFYKVINFEYYSPIYGWRPVIVNGDFHEVDFSQPVNNWPRYVPNLQRVD